LLDKKSISFDKVCEWNYNWWGKRYGCSMEQVVCFVEHSMFENRIPQIFVALLDNVPVRMYQFSMTDDLEHRPDISMANRCIHR